jgi:hypothetical protein
MFVFIIIIIIIIVMIIILTSRAGYLSFSQGQTLLLKLVTKVTSGKYTWN